MATIGEISSTTIPAVASASTTNSCNDKPVILRIKRKHFQSRVDGLWLEISERPSKRAALYMEKLLISDFVDTTAEELRPKKVFVKHVETVSSSETTMEIVQSFVSNAGHVGERKSESEEPKWSSGKESTSASNARFEQVWRSQNSNKEPLSDKSLHDMCHFYEVVRLDRSSDVQTEEISIEEQRILSSYLPLLREFSPSAAAELESGFRDYMPKEAADDYVYDYYTVNDDMDIDENALSPFPLVQVEDEDFDDGSDEESEFDTDDSNAEKHPRNEYPDEPSEEDSEASYKSDEENGVASSTSSEHDFLSSEEVDGNISGDQYYDGEEFEDGGDEFDYNTDDDYEGWSE